MSQGGNAPKYRGGVKPGPKTRPLSDRFWEKVDKNGPVPAHKPELGRCYVWTGGKTVFGHGVMIFGVEVFGKRTFKGAHVVAYFLAFGHWPEGELRHLCDNPACVKVAVDDVGPAHILEGTHAENMADAKQKRRMKAGGRKLSLDDIHAIRSSNEKATVLARRFGVHYRTIASIRTGASWRDV